MTEDSNWAPPSSSSSSTPPPAPTAFTSGSFGAPTPVENGARLGAALLDGLLMVVTLFIGWLVWSVVLYSQSTSPAKKMMGLQIVDAKTGAPATMQQMLLREVLGKIVLGSISRGVTGIVSAVMVLAMPNRQGIHDYIAKTVVVRK